jgi:hypothetical protein
MGKQKRKQAEPEVSNKALKLDKKSKPDTKPAPKSAESPKQSSKVTGSAPKPSKVKKSEKKRPADEEQQVDEPLPELPTVANDAQLKQIAEKTKKAEQLAESKEKEDGGEEAAREVVKVRRSQPSLKLKESTAKSYLAISGPAEDNKTVTVPSYSYIKNRGIVYIRYRYRKQLKAMHLEPVLRCRC